MYWQYIIWPAVYLFNNDKFLNNWYKVYACTNNIKLSSKLQENICGWWCCESLRYTLFYSVFIINMKNKTIYRTILYVRNVSFTIQDEHEEGYRYTPGIGIPKWSVIKLVIILVMIASYPWKYIVHIQTWRRLLSIMTWTCFMPLYTTEINSIWIPQRALSCRFHCGFYYRILYITILLPEYIINSSINLHPPLHPYYRFSTPQSNIGYYFRKVSLTSMYIFNLCTLFEVFNWKYGEYAIEITSTAFNFIIVSASFSCQLI